MIDKITTNMEFSNYNFKVHVKDFDTTESLNILKIFLIIDQLILYDIYLVYSF